MHGAQGGSATNLVWEVFGDVLRFPLWWYGEGLYRTVKGIANGVRGYARTLGLAVWMKNLFTPMFGRYDWQSRMISVFMRSVNIAGRGFVTAIVAMIGVGVLVVYIALPIVAGVFVLFHATSFFLL